MRQFDIVQLHDRKLVVLLQSDLLEERETRGVAPLISTRDVRPTPRLHVPVKVGRKSYFMATEKLAAIQRSEISSVVGSVADRDYELRRALDVVFSGF